MPHIHTRDGEFDFTVAGYIVYNNTTLLIKHKYLPIWTPPAGHVETNQTPIDALYAEIQEEAGLERDQVTLVPTTPDYVISEREPENIALPLPFDLEVHPITDTHQHINMAYLFESTTNHVEPGSNESNTFKWFTIDELREFRETKKSIIASAIFAIETVAEKGSK